MAKARDTQKTEKKKSEKTLKEKRKEKKEKKEKRAGFNSLTERLSKIINLPEGEASDV